MFHPHQMLTFRISRPPDSFYFYSYVLVASSQPIALSLSLFCFFYRTLIKFLNFCFLLLIIFNISLQCSSGFGILMETYKSEICSCKVSNSIFLIFSFSQPNCCIEVSSIILSLFSAVFLTERVSRLQKFTLVFPACFIYQHDKHLNNLYHQHFNQVLSNIMNLIHSWHTLKKYFLSTANSQLIRLTDLKSAFFFQGWYYARQWHDVAIGLIVKFWESKNDMNKATATNI